MAEDISVAAVKDDRSRLFGKHRWRGKKNGEDSKEKFTLNEDVVDFLKPSSQKLTPASAPKPKIDVAAAQRWPGAHDIRKDPSPGYNGPSSMRGRGPGKKGKILTVNFVRTAPEVIGEGGDMSEEPAIEVSRRKSMAQYGSNRGPSTHQDDISVGLRSPGMMGGPEMGPQDPGADTYGDRRPSLLNRAQTSHAELSPPLKEKMDSYSAPPPRIDPIPGDGMGFRPTPLKRAPTGAMLPDDDGVPRPSFDSDDFDMRTPRRTQIDWSESLESLPEKHESDASSLQEVNSGAEGLARKYTMESGSLLESSPVDPKSFSARIHYKMRAEEGRALHEAMLRRQVDDNLRPSSSDSGSVGEASVPSPHQSPARSSYERTFSAQGRSPIEKSIPPRPLLDRPSTQQKTSILQYSSSLESEQTAWGDQSPARRMQESPYQQTMQAARKPLPQQRLFQDSQPAPPRLSPLPPQLPLDFQPALPKVSPLPPPQSSLQSSNQHSPLPLSPGFQAPLPSSQRVIEADSSMFGASQAGRSRADSNAAREAALDDFGGRVTHMRAIFRLTAEIEQPITSYTPMQWLRASLWWFLRARASLEALIRNRPRYTGPPESRPQEKLGQPHVDLAKTWWILSDVIPTHPSMRRYGDGQMASQSRAARDAGDEAMAEIYDAYDVVMTNMKALLASVAKHGVMPPEQSLIQGQDQSIWIKYPQLTPDVAAILSGGGSKGLVVNTPKQSHNPVSILPLGDTRNDFCYGRMFINVSLSTDDAGSDRVVLPCVLTILRPREEWTAKLAICSQSERLTVLVQTDRNAGPTWDDVHWKTRSRGLAIQLSRNFSLNLEFQENDFKQLRNIYDYTRKVEGGLQPAEDEALMQQIELREFRYTDTANPPAFPAEPVKRCLVTVFEKFECKNEGTGLRRFHRGYRFLVVTSPKSKSLSSVTHNFGSDRPIQFEFKSDGETAAMLLRVTEAQRQSTMLLVFNDPNERTALYNHLNGMNLRPEEAVSTKLPLKSLTVTQPDYAALSPETEVGGVLSKLQWQDVKVLNEDPDNGSSEMPKTVLSESLRIVARHGAGTMTDWMNLGPGELQIRLDTNGSSEVHIQRAPQDDLAVSIDPKHCGQGVPESMASLLKTLTSSQTIRTFSFHNLNDLHNFQTAITGFTVKFDGVASWLNIARRRMVVPIYKKWEAQSVRVQIVSRDGAHQLVAFFDGFSHAEAMNFSIKSMDVFEKIDKRGEWALRLVDAKFALAGGKGEGREGKGVVKSRFACLDLLEYAGEHDDITIGFGTKEDRDRFSDALPAATQVVRSVTMRRKI